MTRLDTEQMSAGSARARIADWPYEPDVAQIVLLDHHMLPTPSTVAGWVSGATAQRPSAHTIRTGAMFPQAAEAFRAVGFHTIDTLALLEARLDPIGRRSTARRSHRPVTQRMRPHHLAAVAALDRQAFGDPWGNDVGSLAAISDATPRHRARVVTARAQLGGFAISGQSGVFGYLQRLAVHPDARRQGIARALVADSLQWMRRRGAGTAMVNTGVDNEAALALYAEAGFRRRTDTLTILELTLAAPVDPASNAVRSSEHGTRRGTP